MSDSLNRGYLLTIPYIDKNNKKTTAKEIYFNLKNFDFFVFQIEKGNETNYKHYQIYVEHDNKIRFSSLKSKFPTAHIEKREGTKKQAYEYCTKKDTRIHGPYEFGIRPNFTNEKKAAKKLKEDMLNDIIDGMSDKELLINYPTIFDLKKVNEYRQILGVNLYLENRELTVNYLYGSSGVGKSSFIRLKHNPKDIYVVSDYERDPFGSYRGQKIIVFEEYRSNFSLTTFLQYLDIYPIELPARYNNKQALYTTVYIVSNWTIEEQYKNHSKHDKAALLRRIHNYYIFDKKTIKKTVFKNGIIVDKQDIDNPIFNYSIFSF